MTYRFSEAADQDVVAITFQGAMDFGREQSVVYHGKLLRCCQFLSENPRAARLRQEVDPPVRAYPCQSHIIIYEIDDADCILILRIHHGRENWLDL
jgi:toxin ParE1/3/4